MLHVMSLAAWRRSMSPAPQINKGLNWDAFVCSAGGGGAAGATAGSTAQAVVVYTQSGTGLGNNRSPSPLQLTTEAASLAQAKASHVYLLSLCKTSCDDQGAWQHLQCFAQSQKMV